MYYSPINSGPKCVQFEIYGECQNGVTCLFGDSHIDRASGKSIVAPTGKQRVEINQLSHEARTLLRKKKYEFSSAKKSVADGSFDSAALPQKEIKLVDFSNKVYIAPLTTVGIIYLSKIYII